MADYIERQAALHAVNEFFHDPKVDIALNAVPAANVREDVQAAWLNPDEPICCAIKCSACGETEYLDEPDQYKHWRFCPNCGARMTGGGEL